MNVFPLANANASVISVTGTAAYILALIDTAGSTSHTFPKAVDALDITPEDGDIRIIVSPVGTGTAPTASKGFLIKQGATLMLRHTDIRTVKAISTSGTVSCSLQVGLSEQAETTVISGGGGAITSIIPGTGATNLGKAEDSAHTSGDTGVAVLTKRTDTPASSASTDGNYATANTDSTGHLWSRDGFAPVYENNTTGKALTEENYTNTRVTADGQIKASAGFVRHISFAATGTVTAGVITLYDNTAESGTVMWSGTIQVGTAPVTVPIHAEAGTGIYVGYDGTIANVATNVSWR